MNKMNGKWESALWKTADALRGNQSAEEYMHVVIGIMFLKYLSNNFDYLIEKYNNDEPDYELNLEDKDDLAMANISFIIPEKARWEYIAKFASSPKIGEIINIAFEEIEKKNSELIGLFEKNYNRESLDQIRLGMVVSEFSNLNFQEFGEDIIGRTYEYFLGEFFKNRGQKGGEFYTPNNIVKLMVEIINPIKGKIYDPAAGTGGMLVQARNHIKNLGKNPDLLVAYGQEFQNNTWRLSKINLLLHGFPIDNIQLGQKSADTFREDLHKNEKFDYVFANPPFNLKNWGAKNVLNENDERWKWGFPPKNNANYAWVSHMIHKLNAKGKGATILANGSLSSSNKQELNIRKNLIKDNYIEAIISLPDKLFYTVSIPSCIWVFNKNKSQQDVLMINASDFKGKMISKKLRELIEEENDEIIKIYKNFQKGQKIENIGFAKSINLEEIKENDYSFVPSRYVGFKEEIINKEETKNKIKDLITNLEKSMDKFQKLLPEVKESIKKISINQNKK